MTSGGGIFTSIAEEIRACNFYAIHVPLLTCFRIAPSNKRLDLPKGGKWRGNRQRIDKTFEQVKRVGDEATKRQLYAAQMDTVFRLC